MKKNLLLIYIFILYLFPVFKTNHVYGAPFLMGFQNIYYDNTLKSKYMTWYELNYYGNIVTVNIDQPVPWLETLNGAPITDAIHDTLLDIDQLDRSNHFLLLAIDPLDQSRNYLQDLPEEIKPQQFSNEDLIKIFTEYCSALIEATKPAGFCFMKDLNKLIVQHPEKQTEILNFLNKVYNNLKTRFPSTGIYFTINAETFWNSLLNNDTFQAETLRKAMGSSDLLGVSIFPFEIFQSPYDIGEDYLEKIKEISRDKPFAITATGWPAEPVEDPAAIDLWSTPELQSVYLQWILRQGMELNALFVTWQMPTDLDLLWYNTLESNDSSASLRLWKDMGLQDSYTPRISKFMWTNFLNLPPGSQSTLNMHMETLPANPILKIDEEGRNILWNDPSVIKEGENHYTMWLSGGDISNGNSIKIYRSLSKDGINWTPPEKVMETTPGRWDSGRIETPVVIKVNNTYHMYYSGCSDRSSGGCSDGVFDIGHAVSTNGIDWHRDSQPVIRHHEDSTKWGFYSVAEPAAIYDDEHGLFYLYYSTLRIREDISLSKKLSEYAEQGICMAFSSDGYNFTPFDIDGDGIQDNIMIQGKTNPPAWGFMGYSSPGVMKDSFGIFHLFYSIVYSPDSTLWVQTSMGHAVSSNGLFYTITDPDIMTTGDEWWTDTEVRAPSVLQDGCLIYMWYAGHSDWRDDAGIGFAYQNICE